MVIHLLPKGARWFASLTYISQVVIIHLLPKGARWFASLTYISQVVIHLLPKGARWFASPLSGWTLVFLSFNFVAKLALPTLPLEFSNKRYM